MMRGLKPIPQPTAPGDRQDSPGVEDAAPAVEDFIGTQQALGATIGESFGAAAVVHGAATVSPLLNAELARTGDSDRQVELLRDVAKMSPMLANAALNDCLTSGKMPEWKAKDNMNMGFHFKGCDWITSLDGWPDDASVVGLMDVSGCTSLERLPDGLEVGWGLNLWGCTSLVHLPAFLQVGWDLDLGGCCALADLPEGLDVAGDVHLAHCVSWNGQIPDDAMIAGAVCTDRHPYPGLSLAEWRQHHPHGEKG